METTETLPTIPDPETVPETRPVDTCEVCGEDVAPDEGRRADLSVGGGMCPTPMVLHDACYESIGAIWDDGRDSTCVIDPAYPETQQWTPYEDLTGPRGHPRS